METLQNLLDSSTVPALTALLLGLLTAISPCPLATNIAAMGYLAREVGNRRRIFVNGLLYTAGRILAYTLLGAACLRDIGYHFPDTDPRFKGIDSRKLLVEVMRLVREKGYKFGNADITVCAEQPKLNPHVPAMQAELARCIGCDPDCVSIKATTTERLGYTGRGEGIAAYATVLIEKQ